MKTLRTDRVHPASLLLPRIHGWPGKRPASTLLAASGVWYLLACGAQAPPQAPRVERPERVQDLAVAQLGRTLEIAFTHPLRATDGERLSKPIEVVIYRTTTPAGRSPTPDSAALKPWLTLLSADLARYANGTKIVYIDTLSDQEFGQAQGATFSFALRVLTRGFRRRPLESELSNTVARTLLDVSAPVEKIEVTPTEKALELRWSPPGAMLGSRAPSTPSSYRVYRSATGKPGSFQLLSETASSTYLDADFKFDRPVFYRVRAVFKEGGQVAESEDSEIAQVTPHDTFPPATPAGLSALYTSQAVELIWSANSEPDLAGYNVYRGEGAGPPRQINPELLRTPIFRDASVEKGLKYFYKVTAVDLVGNESPPSAEVAVEAK